MSEVPDIDAGLEIPVFSECVIGYREWGADRSQQLTPMTQRRGAWVPGINTARCDCRSPGSLQFEWSWQEGRRVIEPTPAHEAPDEACSCGLYSLRRPRREWFARPELSVPPRVVGAVASWGRMQVHGTGFRAEHSCVVALGRHRQAPREAVQELERIAARYRAPLVPIEELEEAARRYGAPVPDSLHAAAGAPGPPASPAPASPPPASQRPASTPPVFAPAPDLAPEDLPPRAASRPTSKLGLIDPLARPRREAGFRVRAAWLAVEGCVAAAFIALAVIAYNSGRTTSYVQRHGIRETGYVEAVHRHACGVPYSSQTCLGTSLSVQLTRPVLGVRRVQINYPNDVGVPPDRRVTVRVDPRDAHYAELAGQPRTTSVIWILALIAAAIAVTVTSLDGVALLRKRNRYKRRTAQVAG